MRILKKQIVRDLFRQMAWKPCDRCVLALYTDVRRDVLYVKISHREMKMMETVKSRAAGQREDCKESVYRLHTLQQAVAL